MVPTFSGRLQTRLFALGLVGLIWNLVIAPVLTLWHGVSAGAAYRVALFSWAAALVIGLVVWEPIYHGLMQFRWEKDWPSLYLLLEGIPEGLVVWGALVWFGPDAPGGAFAFIFATTWLVTFLTIEGPMRVLFIRWRFRGGRLSP